MSADIFLCAILVDLAIFAIIEKVILQLWLARE